jgi:hypothetical protein
MAEEQCAECGRRVTQQEENTQARGLVYEGRSGVRVLYVCKRCLTDEGRAYYSRPRPRKRCGDKVLGRLQAAYRVHPRASRTPTLDNDGQKGGA